MFVELITGKIISRKQGQWLESIHLRISDAGHCKQSPYMHAFNGPLIEPVGGPRRDPLQYKDTPFSYSQFEISQHANPLQPLLDFSRHWASELVINGDAHKSSGECG